MRYFKDKDRREQLSKYYKRRHEIERRLGNDPNSIDLLSQLAEVYNLTLKYNKAIEISNKILKLEGKNKSASNNLFYAYDMSEDFESTLKVLERYLRDFQLEKRRELKIFGFSRVAERYFKKKRVVSYVIASKMPFDRPSEVIDINFSTFFHFSKIGWSEKNTEVLNLILEIYPHDVDILNARGYSYLSRNELLKAKVSLDKALSIDGKNFKSNLLLGCHYRKTGKFGEAKEVLFSLLRDGSFFKFQSDNFIGLPLNSTDDDKQDLSNLMLIITELALLYYENGYYREAIERFSKLLKISGNHNRDTSMVGIYNYLGKAYQALGSKKKALKIFNFSLRIDPSSVEVLTSLGHLYLERRMYYKALKVNEKCLSIDPKFEPALKLQEELSQFK